MLSELAVRNLGVIDEASVVVGSGMTVVTGETGVGKTLVVGAIDLLIGGRADAALVRPGAAEAEVEGRFIDGDAETVLRRVIPADGRSRAYIDGRLATAARLSELGRSLVDLHGQHAHQSLLRGAVQRAALDRFAAIDASELRSLGDDLRSVDSALAELGGDARERLREIDLLSHQLSEIDAAAIDGADEDERLDSAESLLADAADHQRAAHQAVALLDSDGAVADGLGRVQAVLGDRAPFSAVSERLAAVAAEISDLATEARTLGESIKDDPAALDSLRERRALLAGLRRKYGATLGDVIEFRSATARRLSELESFEERAAAAERRKAEVEQRLAVERRRVLAARAAAAPELAAAVEAHLRELAMGAARLAVSVEGSAGEQVSLRLAANPGHEPQPLRSVASGGELARTMLALRLVLTEGPSTLVFDEVDAGIGGVAAQAVGRSLAQLGAAHQVIVVTHLAQVAACGDNHIVVEKSQSGASTTVGLRILRDEDRPVELSRMLSGSPHSASARRHAEELLAAANRPRADPPDPPDLPDLPDPPGSPELSDPPVRGSAAV
ncbi:MAG: DNA repair protein RecN [Acidimicrobiaceae bacterium]|nr:DNA repair protein RecN [Acidimicrobiaceae bacterium]MCY4280156.1 DNA repair protein RecN [Acidimicrobiaceae bacterium]MCY4293398.1 DNA repair protein RecN [Acidimicrobiaceae bacterium]